VACAVSPSTVLSGQSVIATAQATSPQGRPLTYSYAVSAGTITGTTAHANLNTADTAPGLVTVACIVVDDKGQTASANAAVSIAAPPQPVAVMTQNLCSISFARFASAVRLQQANFNIGRHVSLPRIAF